MSNVIMQLEVEPVKKAYELDTIVLSSDLPANVNKIIETKSSSSLPFDIKKSKWGIVKDANRILPRASRGEIKLDNILTELRKLTIAEQEFHEAEQTLDAHSWNYFKLYRRHFTYFLRQPTFHYIIILLVITDLIVVLVDLVLAQLSTPCLTEAEMEEYNTTQQRASCLLEHSIQLARAESFLFYFSVILLGLFVLEIFITFYAFGWKYYKNFLYLLDATIVFSSFVMEMYFHYGNIGRAGRAAAAIVILRLWKIVRAVHAVAHSITVKNRLLIKKIQDAQASLEEEKEQTEQTLEKQEIKLEYFTDLLTKAAKLPTKMQIETYVNNRWNQMNKPT